MRSMWVFSSSLRVTDVGTDVLLLTRCTAHIMHLQVVSTKVEVNQNYLGERAFQAYQMVASSQIMQVCANLRVLFVLCCIP
jgi:hypothetical protein